MNLICPSSATTEAAWLAEVIERARDLMRPSGIFAPGRDFAQALVMLADQQPQPSAHQVVYAVLCHEGVGTDIDSVWRTEQEAQDEVGRLRRMFPGYEYSVQPNALQGAR